MSNKKIKSENFEQNSNVQTDKQTKQKSNAQKAVPWFIVAIVALLVILTCTLIAYYQVYRSSKKMLTFLKECMRQAIIQWWIMLTIWRWIFPNIPHSQQGSQKFQHCKT